MCPRTSQRWLALLRIRSALAQRLLIRRSRGLATTESFPRQARSAHIFQARSLQVFWRRGSQSGPRTLSKRNHLLDLKRQTRSLNTRNVQSHGYRGKHSKTSTVRCQTLGNNSGTKPSLRPTCPQCVDSHPLERRWRRRRNSQWIRTKVTDGMNHVSVLRIRCFLSELTQLGCSVGRHVSSSDTAKKNENNSDNQILGQQVCRACSRVAVLIQWLLGLWAS